VRDPRTIIRRPYITEKSNNLKEASNQYAFVVDRRANKVEVKWAVEKLFRVNVLDVKTMVMKGKPKRMGRFEGRRPNWKKALVKLKEGDTIGIFEGT